MPTLRELIAAHADVAAAVAAGNDVEAARLLNEPSETASKPDSWLTERGVMSVVAIAALAQTPAEGVTLEEHQANAVVAAETAMQGLEAAANANPAIARAVRWLKDVSTGGGLDMGDPVNQAMIVSLQAAGALSSVAANALLAYGSQQVGKAFASLGRDVTSDEISREYATERCAVQNAAVLAERTSAWQAAKAAYDASAPEDEDFETLEAAYAAATRKLRDTLGGQEVIASA